MNDFFSGISMITFFASALFFLKFWRASHERLFLFFCWATTLLGLERVGVFVGTRWYTPLPVAEGLAWVYLIRLMSFVIIIYAILDRNRSNASR